MLNAMKVRNSRKKISLLALTSIALLLGGCGIGGKSKPANFYVLTGLPEDTPPIAQAGNVTVGVGQVKIPNFLDRPQIVTLVAANQIALSEFDRWGESFQEGVTRVLREDVAVYLGSQEVAAFPWLQPFPKDYVVHVVVLAFEAAPYRDEVLLRVMYRITDPKQTQTFLVKESEFKEPLTTGSSDYASMADTMSAALAALSKEIAQEVTQLPLPPKN